MHNRREQVFVGIFVLVGVAILIGVVMATSGAFSRAGIPHKSYFKYASGLVAGVPVRYGGLDAGRVDSVRVDPQDSTRIEIDFTVAPQIPVKTNSEAKITALGVLGENYLEVTTGTKDAPLAPPGSVLKSREMMSVADIGELISELTPTVKESLNNLNARLIEAKDTIAQVNDLLNERNRKNIASSLENMNAMLVDTRPKLKVTLSNVQEATEKLPALMKTVEASTEKIGPLLDDFKATVKQVDETLAKVDAMIVENRPDLRAIVQDMRKALSTAPELVETLKNTLDRNSDNLDETLANIREATENMKELSDTLKRNPSVILRGEIGKDRKPGDKK